MSKFMEKLYGKPKEEIATTDLNDFIYPLQNLMNAVHDIVEARGWDVSEWNMKDLDKFSEAAGKFGK